MNILLVYATNSGGTYLSSQIVEDILQKAGHQVKVQKAVETNPADLNNYDLVILGSPSWWVDDMDGQPQEEMKAFMQKAVSQKIPGKKFAIYGLGDTSYMHFCGAVDHMEKFVSDVGGELIVPSLRIDGFYFDQVNNEGKVREWAKNIGSMK